MYTLPGAEASCSTIPRKKNPCSYSTLAFSIYLLGSLVIILVLFQIQSLTVVFSSTSHPPTSWDLIQHLGNSVLNPTNLHLINCSHEKLKLMAMAARLQDSVTFLPLKDLRFAKSAMQGNTWFMSSLNDTYEGDESEYLFFPSAESKNRFLCVISLDRSDGGRNSYALAWPDSLPHGATLLEGLTYVSDTYYDYHNIWHALSAMLPFVGWYQRKGCTLPTRWILYHWGELRMRMGPWIRTLMEATFGLDGVNIETFDGDSGRPTCFERAVVFRHNLGRMGRNRRVEVFDMLRCKARAYCNATEPDQQPAEPPGGSPTIGLTLLLRTGARSFKEEEAVVDIFRRACEKVEGCRFQAAHSNNLTFCDQVRLMRSTDVLASPHGAQLTNMFFMDRNSSVMEFFPRGWRELAGAGQYVYHWEAAWSGMVHRGAWRDHQGDECPPPLQGGACFSFYKSGKLGYNETYFTDWTLDVLGQVKKRKIEAATLSTNEFSECPCS